VASGLGNGVSALLHGAKCPLLSMSRGNKPRHVKFVTPKKPRRTPLIFRVENMAKALTVRTIDTLATPEARREVPDGLLRGLYLVLQPSGARSWAVRYRNRAGTPRKHTLGTYPAIDLRSARELAQQALIEVAKGSDPAADRKAARTGAKVPTDRDLVEKVAEQFVERYAKANTKSWPEAKRILDKEVVAHWRGRHLGAIGRADVHELLDGVVDRGSPVMANRVLAALRKLCAWSVDRGIITASPCTGIKAPTAERSRDRVLSDDELRGVWTACDAIGWPFGALVKLLLLTGQRRDEVGRMRWSELDLGGKTWTLPRERAKNGVAHTVPLSEPVLTILAALPRIASAKGEDYVFTVTGKTAVSGFSNAKERIDALLAASHGEPVPAWVFHDLRRTAATGMARLGTALPVVERVLNHVSGSFGGIVGVYQKHGFADEKRHALTAWGAFVERFVSAEPGANVVALQARAS